MSRTARRRGRRAVLRRCRALRRCCISSSRSYLLVDPFVHFVETRKMYKILKTLFRFRFCKINVKFGHFIRPVEKLVIESKTLFVESCFLKLICRIPLPNFIGYKTNNYTQTARPMRPEIQSYEIAPFTTCLFIHLLAIAGMGTKLHYCQR